jgi:plasmid maintenance system antidote protein VapI
VQVYNKLKGKLVEKGKTYNDCAEAIKVSKTTFSKKINGQTDFTTIEVKNLIEFLGLESKDAIDIFLT